MTLVVEVVGGWFAASGLLLGGLVVWGWVERKRWERRARRRGGYLTLVGPEGRRRLP